MGRRQGTAGAADGAALTTRAWLVGLALLRTAGAQGLRRAARAGATAGGAVGARGLAGQVSNFVTGELEDYSASSGAREEQVVRGVVLVTGSFASWQAPMIADCLTDMAADVAKLPAVHTNMVINAGINGASYMDYTFSVLPADRGQANIVVTALHFLWQDEYTLLTTLKSKVSTNPSLSEVTLTGVSLESVSQVTELAVTPSTTRTTRTTTRTETSDKTSTVTSVTTSLISETTATTTPHTITTVSTTPHTVTLTDTGTQTSEPTSTATTVSSQSSTRTTTTLTTYTYTYYTTTEWVGMAIFKDGDQLWPYLMGGAGIAVLILLAGFLIMVSDCQCSYRSWRMPHAFPKQLDEPPAPTIIKGPFQRLQSWPGFPRRISASNPSSPSSVSTLDSFFGRKPRSIGVFLSSVEKLATGLGQVDFIDGAGAQPPAEPLAWAAASAVDCLPPPLGPRGCEEGEEAPRLELPVQEAPRLELPRGRPRGAAPLQAPKGGLRAAGLAAPPAPSPEGPSTRAPSPDTSEARSTLGSYSAQPSDGSASPLPRHKCDVSLPGALQWP